MKGTVVLGVLLAGTVSATPATVIAGDGCTEISPVNVATAGTITEPGCYVLTGNLQHRLTISDVSNVTLDLNGFTVSADSGGSYLPAIGLGGAVEGIEIRNGSVAGIGTDAIGTLSGFTSGKGIVLRDLRLRTTGSDNGINFEVGGARLEAVRIEDTVITSSYHGIAIVAAYGSGDTSVTGFQVVHCQIRSSGHAFHVYDASDVPTYYLTGFLIEDSTLRGGTDSAVSIHTMWADDGRFSGTIRDCTLTTSPSSSGTPDVVYYDSNQGTLLCAGNTVTALGNETNAHAFATEDYLAAKLVITGNTTAAATSDNGTYSAVRGPVQSPVTAYDSNTGSYLHSNWDVNAGAY